MRYKLRTLLILLAVLPPLLWLGWGNYQAWKAEAAGPTVHRPKRCQELTRARTY